MKNKLLLIVIPVLLLLVAATFVITNTNKQANVALNEYNYISPVGAYQGQLKYELTFDNIVNKYSSNIIIGKVISSEKYTENVNMYKINVDENLLGQVADSTIYVQANKYSLLPEKKYMLFMREHDYSLYSNIFYTPLHEFVVQLDENENLLLLQDPEKQQFIKPFKDSDMNTLDNIRTYIGKIKKNNMYINNPKKKVVDEASNPKELINLSNHIIEISVLEARISGNANNIAIVDYDCYKKYKGGNFKNINKLLLPPTVEKGKSYLLFLAGDDESVSPATRKGSVIEVGTEEYNNIVHYLN